ncbi:MAG: type II toxin-antitoxin system VapC family toxin [Hyphomicrobium sp.]
MRNIVVDAGPLIALFKKSDRHHKAALAFIGRNETATLVTNLLVVGEVAAMLQDKHSDLIQGLDWLLANIEIDQRTVLDLPAALEIVEKYKDMPADLADASLVALCERRGTNLVASVDRDFEVYRLPRSKTFENVFFA